MAHLKKLHTKQQELKVLIYIAGRNIILIVFAIIGGMEV